MQDKLNVAIVLDCCHILKVVIIVDRTCYLHLTPSLSYKDIFDLIICHVFVDEVSINGDDHQQDLNQKVLVLRSLGIVLVRKDGIDTFFKVISSVVLFVVRIYHIKLGVLLFTNGKTHVQKSASHIACTIGAMFPWWGS